MCRMPGAGAATGRGRAAFGRVTTGRAGPRQRSRPARAAQITIAATIMRLIIARFTAAYYDRHDFDNHFHRRGYSGRRQTAEAHDPSRAGRAPCALRGFALAARRDDVRLALTTSEGFAAPKTSTPTYAPMAQRSASRPSTAPCRPSVTPARSDVLRTDDGEAVYRACRTGEHHHHLVCRICRPHR